MSISSIKNFPLFQSSRFQMSPLPSRYCLNGLKFEYELVLLKVKYDSPFCLEHDSVKDSTLDLVSFINQYYYELQ